MSRRDNIVWSAESGWAAPREPEKACSFCGRSADNVAILIAGPIAMICDECVVVCVEEIRKKAAAQGERAA